MSSQSRFLELVDLILSGKINSFSKLKLVLSSNGIKIDKKEFDILFKLIKRLYWGIFSDLNFEEYKLLWKALVVPDEKYPSSYGDLKKSVIVADLYISLLDIHGYTSFCQKTRRNINSLHRLDRFVETIIKNTTKKYGVVSRRERGDEVILVGGDPVDIVNATFDVINLFSKQIPIPDVEKEEESFLPPFEISGGIVGGYSTMPLIVSESGDIQGLLINLAARLQARANTISPSKTKVIIDQSTYHKFISSDKPKTDFVKNLKFIFNGDIEFKGGKLKVYEVYYRDDEKYKDLISQHIRRLTEAISRNEWQSNIVATLAEIGIITSDNMPKFSKTVEVLHDDKIETIEVDNEYLSKNFMQIKYSITNSRDYRTAMEKLSLLVKILDQVNEFDQIVKDYCKAIYREFEKIFYEYERILISQAKQNALDLLTPNEVEVLSRFDSQKEAYSLVLDKLHSDARSIQKRVAIWNKAFNNVRNQIKFSIYTGKK